MAGELQRLPETSSNVEILKHAITINQLIGRYLDTGVLLDHGTLTGLSDDDHPHYYNSARLATALSGYYTIAAADITFAPIVHTHASTAISDFSEAVDDRVAALLTAGTNIALTYNDAGGTLTIDSNAGGASLAGSWSFDTGTTAADPGNKKIRFNNATLASVTAIYVNDTTNQNFDASTVLGFLATGNRIYVQQKNNAAKAALFEVSGALTDNTGWWTIPVTVVDSATLMDNASDCAVVMTFGGGGSPSVALNDLTDVNTAGVADGDVLTYDTGTAAWLPAAPAAGAGGLAFVGSAEVTGSAVTSFTLSSLDLDTDKAYVVEIKAKNSSGSNAIFSVFFNGDTTATNYYSQRRYNDNTATGSTRDNTSYLDSVNSSMVMMAYGYLFDTFDGHPTISFPTFIKGAPSAIQQNEATVVRNNTANVTSITLSSDIANSIAVGSKIRVWKLVE